MKFSFEQFGFVFDHHDMAVLQNAAPAILKGYFEIETVVRNNLANNTGDGLELGTQIIERV